jgi:hypothetical protein
MSNEKRFDELRRKVMRSGFLIERAGNLRDMEASKKLGSRVRNSISEHLQRRGIVHFPSLFPTSQSDIVILVMKGSPSERQWKLVFDARREGSACESAETALSRNSKRPLPKGGQMDPNVHSDNLACGQCGRVYSIEEALTDFVDFWSTPYNYGASASRCCLGCFLGVGPKDFARMEAEFERMDAQLKEMMTDGGSAPREGKWLESMTKLGWSPRKLADELGITERAVRYWIERNTLPNQGTTARLVNETLRRALRERGLSLE